MERRGDKDLLSENGVSQGWDSSTAVLAPGVGRNCLSPSLILACRN
jgi:hypothetical protein